MDEVITSTLKDLVDELVTLNTDNLLARVETTGDVQWCLSELQDILGAMEEGKLLELPCPIGTPVYCHDIMCVRFPTQVNADCMYAQDCPRHNRPCPLRVVRRPFTVQMHKNMGKTFWLTQEEAEAAIPPERRNRPCTR